MVASYNGWKASKTPADFGGLDNRIVPGTKGVRLAPGVRAGDFAVVAFYFAEQLDKRVEDGDLYTAGDEWGWYFKQSANSAALLSCHSSGTAWDWNATRHPNGKRGTFTAKQVAEIRKIQAEVDGIIYWGGDAWGNGTVDEMHFELKTGVSVAQLKAVADKLRAGGVKAAVAAPAYKFPIIGGILGAFDQVGGLTALGQPLGPEVPTGDKTGRWQEFANGAIFWHPQVDKGCAHAVQGDIYRLWTKLGRETKTGYPLTNETKTPDGVGRFNHFVNGWSIYWSPTTGAHEVHGLFHVEWEKQGWETGKLGYPITDEQTGPAQTFQHGKMTLVDGKVCIK